MKKRATDARVAALADAGRAGQPHHVARPGIDTERFRPDLAPARSREALGIGEEEFVIVYHGTVHFANQHEMLSLYLSIKLLRLDTNSALTEAGQLYRSTGWTEIERFNDDPYPDLFFEKRL